MRCFSPEAIKDLGGSNLFEFLESDKITTDNIIEVLYGINFFLDLEIVEDLGGSLEFIKSLGGEKITADNISSILQKLSEMTESEILSCLKD
jgi:hypothetical protein